MSPFVVGRGSSRIDPEKLLRLALRMIPFSAGGPELLDIVRDLRGWGSDLDTKVDKASESLKQASALIAELDAELTARTSTVEDLRRRYEKYKALASVGEKETKALLGEVEEILLRTQRKERWIGFGLSLLGGIVIFLLGVLLGPVIRQRLGVTA